MFDSSSLAKTPYKKENWTAQQLTEFALCADPKTGPHYFMSNFFHIQHSTQGKMLYQPFEYQKKLIDTYHNYRFGIAMMPRQSGKSTSAAGYLLWYAMFVPDSTVLIAAHKFDGAQEIMTRVRFAYELCPDHIRAGATNYNKGSIEFENGSRIVSATTTENTGRGMSISLLYCLDGDTSVVNIRNKRTLLEEEITLKNLYIRLVNPNQVLTDNLAIINQHYVNNEDYEILTPNGWRDFRGVIFNQHANKHSKKIIFADGTSIIATNEHRFFINGEETQVAKLQIGDLLDSKKQTLRIADISDLILEDTYEVFDAVGHVIIVNNINSHQCDEFAFVRPTIASEFWTSIAPTLATGGKAIITSTPNSDEDQFALLWKGANKMEDSHGNPQEVGINGFRPYRSHWNEHPDRDEAWAADMKAQLGEDRFLREICCLAGNSLVDIKLTTGEIRRVSINQLEQMLRL